MCYSPTTQYNIISIYGIRPVGVIVLVRRLYLLGYCSHVMTTAWWVDHPLLLSMVCAGSIPSMMIFFLYEKGSKALDLSIVSVARGEAREINVRKSARFNEFGNISLVRRFLPAGLLQSKDSLGQLIALSDQDSDNSRGSTDFKRSKLSERERVNSKICKDYHGAAGTVWDATGVFSAP